MPQKVFVVQYTLDTSDRSLFHEAVEAPDSASAVKGVLDRIRDGEESPDHKDAAKWVADGRPGYRLVLDGEYGDLLYEVTKVTEIRVPSDVLLALKIDPVPQPTVPPMSRSDSPLFTVIGKAGDGCLICRPDTTFGGEDYCCGQAAEDFGLGNLSVEELRAIEVMRPGPFRIDMVVEEKATGHTYLLTAYEGPRNYVGRQIDYSVVLAGRKPYEALMVVEEVQDVGRLTRIFSPEEIRKVRQSQAS